MLLGKKYFISLTCIGLLFSCLPPGAEAGLLSFMGRHLFGHKKDHAKSQTSTASLPKPTHSSHPTRPFSATASWYGGKFNGRRTASGEVFDQNKLTAASRTLPLGTKLLVKNPANGKSCTVVVNDRGPFVAGRDIDLSRAAAQRIGVTGVSPIVCVADTSGALNSGSATAHNGGLLHVPGKVFHMIAGII
jgi:3D (Asp-Asp-Asp) domain-containing protein